jgi:2'-5' RNA ligase
MRYYVCIALPARHAKRIAASMQPGVTPPPSDPHITLVGPGELNEADRETGLVRALRAAVSGLTACPVAYDGVAYAGAKKYFYVRVPRTPWLVRWHEACCESVRNILTLPPQTEPFAPHITLATRLSEQDGEAMWRTVRDRPVQDIFLCKEFILMRQIAHNVPWQRFARLRLAGRPQRQLSSSTHLRRRRPL